MADRIERELLLPASLDEVWARLTDPDWLAEWFADAVTLELVVGGDATFEVDGETRTGWIEELCPPEPAHPGRLAFWWQAPDEPASRVEIEILATDGGTHLRVTETRPLEMLDLVGIPLRGTGGLGAPHRGPALVAG